MEIWRSIPEFPGYEASSLGRIRNRRGIKRQKIYKGYCTVKLFAGAHVGRERPQGRVAKAYCRLVHRLVLSAFVGPCPKGMEASHLDGNRQNNSRSNLAWMTRKANRDLKKVHGTDFGGARNPSAKLTQEQVDFIRKVCPTTRIPIALTEELARKFNVNPFTIRCVAAGHTWRSRLK